MNIRCPCFSQQAWQCGTCHALARMFCGTHTHTPPHPHTHLQPHRQVLVVQLIKLELDIAACACACGSNNREQNIGCMLSEYGSSECDWVYKEHQKAHVHSDNTERCSAVLFACKTSPHKTSRSCQREYRAPYGQAFEVMFVLWQCLRGQNTWGQLAGWQDLGN